MATEIRLPQFGESMTEGTVTRWLVSPGQEVVTGDILCEIEIDKTSLEFESPAEGIVAELLVEPGFTVPVECPLIILAGQNEQLVEDYIESVKEEVRKLSNIEAELGKQQELEADIQDVNEAVKETGTEQQEIRLGSKFKQGKLQRLTAKRMLQSKREIPCFYLTARADVGELVEYREELKAENQKGVSYNDFLIKAVGMGLENFPMMTGTFEGDNIVLADSINIGLAVESPKGLLSPVIKGVESMNVGQIAEASSQLTQKAREGKLELSELEGACITISNLGAFGVESFIPIVIPGQCSILGVGAITESCMADNGGQKSSQLMSLTLSVDHRIANGSYGAKFLDFVKQQLESPANLR